MASQAYLVVRQTLARLGLVEWDGRFREGQPVWVSTERGEHLDAHGWVRWPDGRIFTVEMLDMADVSAWFDTPLPWVDTDVTTHPVEEDEPF